MRRAVFTGAALARKDDRCPVWQNECGNGKLRDPMRNSAIAAPVGREGKGDCKLQCLVNENQWQERWPKVPLAPAGLPEQLSTDHTSLSTWRDLSKCIQCGLCTDVCGEAVQQQHVIGFANRGFDRRPVTVLDTPLGESAGISCGQCTLVARSRRYRTSAMARVTVTVRLPPPRLRRPGRPGNARRHQRGIRNEARNRQHGPADQRLRQLGFDYVFDTNSTADLTIMEEGKELLSRIETSTNLPLCTSCCPGWMNWVELNRPDLLPHLSTVKSPQPMHSAIAKRSVFARSLGEDFAAGKAEPYVVSVMPCTAQKDEALRHGVSGDVDRALTTRELAKMTWSRGIPFGALSKDSRFDSPLG